MKAKTILAVLLTATLGLGILAACGDSNGGTEKDLTDAALTGSTVADFAQGDPGNKVLFASDGWSNGSVFNTIWTNGNLTYSDGAMHLGIKEESKTAWVDGAEKTYDYTSGEARTTYYYGYGDYEVRMKPTSTVGTASTFFVCTGDYDVWPDGTKNPWDEIDIEFLGTSPTKVQFNYFANGVGGHEHMYNLGFDASKEFHNYGFRWTESYITWFVDGSPVYRVDKANVKEGEAFPKTAGRILMNYWCGNQDAEGWMGKFNGPDGKTADYQWVKTSAQKVNPPMGDPYPDTPTPPPATDGTDWSKVAAQKLGFASSDPFTVALSQDELSADITYTAAVGASYKNVEMPAPAAAANTNLAHFKVKNNGEAEVYLRISLINNEKDAENAASGYAKSSDVNISATMDGAAAETNTTNGGSYFTIPAGAEVECVIKFDGVVNRIQLMPDTSKYGDSATHAGSLTVSELKFAASGEVTPPAPDLPDADNKGITVSGTKLTVDGNVDDYVVISDETKNTLRVVYAGLKGGTYQNLWMDASTIARTKNVFSVKVTNSGTEKLTFRIDIESVTKHGTNNIVACNQSAKQDGAEVYTDLDWGSSKFEIEAGKSAVCTVTYDTSMGPTNVKMYFDSCINEDTATHSGDVTLAEMAFSGEGSYTPAEPAEPTPPPATDESDWSELDAQELGFTSTEQYTVAPATDKKSAQITYTNLAGGGYENVEMDITAMAANKTVMHLTVKNNGTATVNVRINLVNSDLLEAKAQNSAVNKSATMDGTAVRTDLDWGGSYFDVPAGQTAECVIVYEGIANKLQLMIDSAIYNDSETHSGDVTVSALKFAASESAGESSTPSAPAAATAITFKKKD